MTISGQNFFLWICLNAALAGCNVNSAAPHDLIDGADEAASGAAAKMSDPLRAATDSGSSAGAAAMKAMPQNEQLALAYKALFGNGNWEILTSAGRELRYDGGKIIWSDDIAILIAPGSNGGSSPVTMGALSIFYLKPDGNKFEALQQFPFAIDGSIMGNPPEWEISHDVIDQPVIISTAGGVWNGFYCATTTLTEIGPERPERLLSFRSSFDNSGNPPIRDQIQSVEGKIGNVRKNTSFDVIFRGTQTFTQQYVRSSDTFVRKPGDTEELIPEC